MTKIIDEKNSTGYIKDFKNSSLNSKHIIAIATSYKVSNGAAKIASPTAKDLYLYTDLSFKSVKKIKLNYSRLTGSQDLSYIASKFICNQTRQYLKSR